MILNFKGADEGLNATVYAELRKRIVTGHISLTMNCRHAAWPANSALAKRRCVTRSRLSAEGAVSIRSKRRVRVPEMTSERFDDLLRCRLLLEPEAAALALPFLTAADVQRLREIDATLDAAVKNGDAGVYMQSNYDFHFTLYRAQPQKTLTQLIETLWLQFGPYMRVLYGRVPNAELNDRHQTAIAAIEKQDATALREAIAHDISDGMGLLGKSDLAVNPAR
ncbi:MAG: GntR family transcriptional regulator [Caulobacteraceae bacterium]|nr:GntR family transcriptional regulator [Caulobacteraceae bacterium]